MSLANNSTDRITPFQHNLTLALSELLSSICRPPKKSTPKRTKVLLDKNEFLPSDNNNRNALESIKNLCKTVREAPEVMFHLLFDDYFLAQHCPPSEKLQALQCAHELFLRSAKFRSLFTASALNHLLLSTLKAQNPALSQETVRIVVEWANRFEKQYPQLRFAVESTPELLQAREKQVMQAQMQAQVDGHRLDEIKRGFRIFDQGVVADQGDQVCEVLNRAESKLTEMDSCLQLLLQWGQTNEEEEEEWEEEITTCHLPNDYELKVSSDKPSNSNNELMSVMRQSAKDCVVEMTKSLLPTIRSWTEILEEKCLEEEEVMVLLLRVKKLLKELGEAVGQGNRLLHQSSG